MIDYTGQQYTGTSPIRQFRFHLTCTQNLDPEQETIISVLESCQWWGNSDRKRHQ